MAGARFRRFQSTELLNRSGARIFPVSDPCAARSSDSLGVCLCEQAGKRRSGQWLLPIHYLLWPRISIMERISTLEPEYAPLHDCAPMISGRMRAVRCWCCVALGRLRKALFAAICAAMINN